ncbi:Adaptor complexes medium subunit family protein [Histomonas meleagridis]|uniref:Adaptor complexes medium subunit family protein n=1 Tax=Histomonas meleagridis TaxID=135588 RepID=UPI0035597CA6|nr:Adaptor complexes medium subunit family protein [Histomonas meleagridis]KAH0799741.1 Adaptor complexes medium subunit family protein [Histomonas meleagridis]
MISAVFLVNNEGVILIEKQYREKIKRSDIDSALIAIKDHTKVTPGIIQNDDLSILLLPREDIWIVGVCEGDEFALFGVSVLQYIGRLLQTQLKNGVSEFSIKDEYHVVYRILDYAVDFGYPLFDECNLVNTLLNRQTSDYSKGERLQLDLEKPWRSCGFKRTPNEILLDVIETIDVSVSEHGRMDFCHIRGSIEATSRLSGTPTCKLVLKPTTHYEDASYHRCVDNTYTGKTITFIPPNGQFTLMRYRVTAAQVNLPVWIIPKFTWDRSSVSFEIILKPDPNLPKFINNLSVSFDLPDGVTMPSFAPQTGRATYDSATREATWTIGIFSGKDPITLKGSASTPPGFELGGRFPIVSAKFSTVGVAPSGFAVERLDVEGENYKSFKGMKYVTASGNYEFRTGLC